MSTNPIFFVNIDYLDCYGNLQTVDIPLSENQNIEVRLLQDKKFIRDKKYLRHDIKTNKLSWFST